MENEKKISIGMLWNNLYEITEQVSKKKVNAFTLGGGGGEILPLFISASEALFLFIKECHLFSLI